MDGRNARVERTKAAIMAACRDAMRAGIFQPTVTDVAKAAEISVRSVFQHYGSVENMRREALEETVVTAILDRVLGHNWGGLQLPEATIENILCAVVFGRVPVTEAPLPLEPQPLGCDPRTA